MTKKSQTVSIRLLRDGKQPPDSVRSGVVLTPHGRESLGGRPFGDGTPPGPPIPAEVVPAAHGAGG